MTSLYICYQSLLEPLTQTQVIAYLEGLARAGYRMVLLTFEPRRLSAEETRVWQATMSAKGIDWHWLTYHKSPTVPATAWDIAAGICKGLELIRRHRVRLIHARAHVPGLMALVLKRLTGAKLLFDVRGFMAEEYVDAGVWPADGLLFRTVKRIERSLVSAADAVVVLTNKAKDLLQCWYEKPMREKRIAVIPCCVDLRKVPRAAASDAAARMLGFQETRFVYAGKLGGWYLDEAMVDFIAVAAEHLPNVHWSVWTQSDPLPLTRLLDARRLGPLVTIGRCAPDALPGELKTNSAALSFIKPCRSKLASSPTKVGEYLAAGLPVVSSPGIGDLDQVLADSDGDGGHAVGVVLNGCTTDAYREAIPRLVRLLRDPETPERCRAAALEYFDLERVGWPRYRSLYREILETRA